MDEKHVKIDQGVTVEELSASRSNVKELSADYDLISRLMAELDREVASFTFSMEKVNSDFTEVAGLTKLWDEQAQIIEHQVAAKGLDSNASRLLTNGELFSKKQPISSFSIKPVDERIDSFQSSSDELKFI
jgi:hypothetical protein